MLREARAGAREAAQQRIDFLQMFNLLEIKVVAETLAREILDCGAMPRQAALDALDLAVAAWHGADNLLTWNCCDIASAHVRPHIDAICRGKGIVATQLCTSGELM